MERVRRGTPAAATLFSAGGGGDCGAAAARPSPRGGSGGSGACGAAGAGALPAARALEAAPPSDVRRVFSAAASGMQRATSAAATSASARAAAAASAAEAAAAAAVASAAAALSARAAASVASRAACLASAAAASCGSGGGAWRVSATQSRAADAELAPGRSAKRLHAARRGAPAAPAPPPPRPTRSAQQPQQPRRARGCPQRLALPPALCRGRWRGRRSAAAGAKRNLRRRGAATAPRGVRTAARRGPPPLRPAPAESPWRVRCRKSRPRGLEHTAAGAPRARAAPLGAKERAEAAAAAPEGRALWQSLAIPTARTSRVRAFLSLAAAAKARA